MASKVGSEARLEIPSEGTAPGDFLLRGVGSRDQIYTYGNSRIPSYLEIDHFIDLPCQIARRAIWLGFKIPEPPPRQGKEKKDETSFLTLSTRSLNILTHARKRLGSPTGSGSGTLKTTRNSPINSLTQQQHKTMSQ
jgi:hypothetical protein